VRNVFSFAFVALGLIACSDEPNPAAAGISRAMQQARSGTPAPQNAQPLDGATLKGATKLWTPASAPVGAMQPPPAQVKPEPTPATANLAMVAPEQRITPVVHRIVHPSLAARVARRSAPVVSRAGDMVGVRGVEVRPGDKVGTRPGDDIN
jgi:hypothetical protein